jgi:glycosyltransferase involved in cell wall biosynthesis
MPLQIALIHNGPAFKPELTAYRAFFASRGVKAEVFRRPRPHELRDFDVEWHFTGLDRLPRQKGRIKVHEYTSSSIPPCARWKNRLKRQFNMRPDLRVFSDRFIRDAFAFRDEVPTFYRPAPAVASGFLDCAPSSEPEFDLVYLGTLHRSRRAVPMLRRVMDRLPEARLLVVNGLEPFLPPAERIHYTGLLPYEEVPQALRRARYGLNLVPNRFPFHRQASLKLAEYAAVGLRVISTDYPWARQFEAERRGRFFFLSPGMRNLSEASLAEFDFRGPHLHGLRWEEVLDQSGVLPWLMERIRSE